MKTLADFKRALTPGSKWETFHVLYNSSMGVREVATIRSNSVGFRNELTGKISWLDFPKASQFKINNGMAEIYTLEGNLLLTYKAVN